MRVSLGVKREARETMESNGRRVSGRKEWMYQERQRGDMTAKKEGMARTWSCLISCPF